MIVGCTDVCRGTFRGPEWSPGMTSDSVRLLDARRQLGKTFYMAVQGGQGRIPQLVLSANTQSRFRHPALGSPYILYVKLVLFLTADVRDPGQLPGALTWPIFDPEDPGLPGAGAGPDREPGGGVVNAWDRPWRRCRTRSSLVGLSGRWALPFAVACHSWPSTSTVTMSMSWYLRCCTEDA